MASLNGGALFDLMTSSLRYPIQSSLPEIIEASSIAISTIMSPYHIILILLAIAFGMLMGILPGLSGTTALALLIPLTYGMDPLPAFMVLTASLGGTNFGGSITSILLKIPGSSVNAATILDGHPMTQQGQGGRAIGASAVSSAAGAVVGILLLLLSIPILLKVILLFGPPEIFWLALWGLAIIAIIVRGAVVTGLISAAIGLLLATHGRSSMTANVRWTYGQDFLLSGVEFVPTLIGLFAVAEMIKLLATGSSISGKSVSIGRDQWRGAKDVWVHRYLFLRSALIGALIGVIPGVGGSAANFIAYFQAIQTSRDSESYGTGDVRGVIAPEASNDAKDGTGFLPTLGFGIPGSASMAVILGAFILHGITPGPLLMRDHLEIVMVIIITLLISNIITSLLGLITAPYLIRVTKIDTRILAPVILCVAFFAGFALRNNIYDLYITMFFGIFGFFMIKSNMSRIPLILGMILGPIIEVNLFRSLRLSGGEWSYLLSSPIAIFLAVLTVVSLLMPVLRPKYEQWRSYA